MFLDELTPVIKQLKQQPVAFLSGFVSGVLKLNLADDPLKTWLQKQGIETPTYSANNSNSPQSINID